MRNCLLLLAVFCPLFTAAHIGSPGVTFEGNAGNYPLMVLINPPQVIPGTASVDIYTDSRQVQALFAKPVFWFAGTQGAPQSDEMLPVPGEPGHFRGNIWLMDNGTWAIEVTVTGSEGEGKVMVPVMAVSTVQRKMDSSLGWTLAGLATLLVVLMITIIGASVSDSISSSTRDVATLKRKRRTGIAVSTLLLGLLLYGGKSWWDGWAGSYQRYMYRPFKATTTIKPGPAGPELSFVVDTTRLSTLTMTRNISYIIPDHGKLMHMFLVRSGSMDVFAHLHPARTDSVTFTTPLPPLPAGQYLVFADVTRLSGFSETIPDTVQINVPDTPVALASDRRPDRDDTYFFTNAIARPATPLEAGPDILVCGKPGVRLPLSDGSMLTWEHDPLVKLQANTLYSLKFNLQDEQGKPAVIEPYMGMPGHAVIMKDDGSVYIHLHPVGSYSMASQQTMKDRFEKHAGRIEAKDLPRTAAFRDSIDQVIERLNALPAPQRDTILMAGMQHPTPDPTHPQHSVVSFPYAFPSAGHYRIWIQMKRNGNIVNSAFDADVVD
ncbi:MAG TPA: hypothetical protein VK658_21000 [Chryseolinea sp.]|nr:hypothetical protein [Chryseolinea sp.]